MSSGHFASKHCSPEQCSFIERLPKAELHLHIEGTLEPVDVFSIADRNERRHLISHATVEKAEAARTFRDLGEFITEIREACSVLMTEADYYEVTRAYLRRAAAQNVRYAELQVAPQEHTTRGVPIATLLSGMHRAMAECAASVDGAAGPISSRLIIDLVKDAPVDDSVACLKEVLRHRDLADIAAVGLAAAELGFPHAMFTPVMDLARSEGLKIVTHAGEEGGPDSVREAIEHLGVHRIDHGIRAREDPALLRQLADTGIGLAVCPLSNWRLQVYQRFCGGANPIGDLLRGGTPLCLNSDDPAFFGGDLNANYRRCAADCDLTAAELAQLARNSFQLSFCKDAALKRSAFAEIDALVGSAAAPLASLPL